MPLDALQEARRQIEICNACRYCEGYCSVFPAMMRQRAFSDGDLTQLANLCHNCRGCYYACQYTEPHEFALNVPAALAEVRSDSWTAFAWPMSIAHLFQRSGVAMALAVTLGFAVLFWLAQAVRPAIGEGFYAVMSHSMMVAIFTPAFLLPLVAIGVSLQRYWRSVGGETIRWAHVQRAFGRAARLADLSGGQGQGCNFERTDRYSDTRRWMHQFVVYGFMLCFAATCAGTIMHYVFGWEAPYGFWTPPKLLGVPGGVLLTIGCAGLMWLKLRAERDLADRRVWGGEMAFILVLLATAVTGLTLYAATGTSAVGVLLPLHLGAVLAFFLFAPYTKMVHGFFRLAALVRDAQLAERGPT